VYTKTVVYNTRGAQCSVATRFGYVRISNDSFHRKSSAKCAVKEVLKIGLVKQIVPKLVHKQVTNLLYTYTRIIVT